MFSLLASQIAIRLTSIRILNEYKIVKDHAAMSIGVSSNVKSGFITNPALTTIPVKPKDAAKQHVIILDNLFTDKWLWSFIFCVLYLFRF